MNNFKSNFLSQGQPGSKSIDKFFLSVLKMCPCYKYFFGNLIFALTARTLSGNRIKYFDVQSHSFNWYHRKYIEITEVNMDDDMGTERVKISFPSTS